VAQDLDLAVRVLVLADTHLDATSIDKLPSEVWAMADAADVILHAGDVVAGALLEVLAARAPTVAVLGNNDRGLIGVLPEQIEVELGGVRVAMVHDSGPTKGREARMARRFPDGGVVVFGHSHQPLCEAGEQGQLLFNPGSPTHRRRQPVHTVGWLELAAGVVQRAEIVEVGPLKGGGVNPG
jgi:putative phosphoesterase